MGLVIFLALIGVPLAEIAVLIEVGSRIGLWSTLGLIVATAVAGTALLRHQGLTTLANARATIDRGEVPVKEVLDGVCLLIAGALLLTPGFVTDAVGGLLLVPAVRGFLQRWAIVRLTAGGRTGMADESGPGFTRAEPVIDGEFTVLNDEDGGGDDRPPWLQPGRKGNSR